VQSAYMGQMSLLVMLNEGLNEGLAAQPAKAVG